MACRLSKTREDEKLDWLDWEQSLIRPQNRHADSVFWSISVGLVKQVHFVIINSGTGRAEAVLVHSWSGKIFDIFPMKRVGAVQSPLSNHIFPVFSCGGMEKYI